jgi:hypothetical protein
LLEADRLRPEPSARSRGSHRTSVSRLAIERRYSASDPRITPFSIAPSPLAPVAEMVVVVLVLGMLPMSGHEAPASRGLHPRSGRNCLPLAAVRNPDSFSDFGPAQTSGGSA